MSETKQESELRALVGRRVRIERRGNRIEGTLKGDSAEWKGFLPDDAPEVAGYKSSDMKLWIVAYGANQIHFAADDGWLVTPLP